jgi:hypothetical protein
MGAKMIISESYTLGASCAGEITLKWVNRQSGEVVPAGRHSNIITFSAADIMAHLLGRDRRSDVTHIGYLYGPSASTLTNPESAVPARLHTFADLSSDLAGITGNMIVSPVGNNPAFEVNGDENHFTGNAVTLSAVSDNTSALIFNGGSFASTFPQPTTDKYFQVALLSQQFDPGSTTAKYVPFARVQTVEPGDNGLVVQSGFELAIFWKITFR